MHHACTRLWRVVHGHIPFLYLVKTTENILGVLGAVCVQAKAAVYSISHTFKALCVPRP